jgi:peptide/nickel transport system substrate-binding protein
MSSLILAGCNGTGTGNGSTTTFGGTNWSKQFGEPQYGGTINLRVADTSDLQFDPYGHPWFGGLGMFHFDCLFTYDWTVDRNEWPFKTMFTPTQYMTGSVAESWEKPDGQTVVVHIRQGVHYQDKPPVNGRELTADDVVFHYHRMCGLGDFTEPCPFFTTFVNLVESITAIDKYTVEFKFKNPTFMNQAELFSSGMAHYLIAPEVVQQYGDYADWKNGVGTGPWILTNFVSGSSIAYVKNPNYFGTDERYPGNQLPYADELNVLCIPDSSTAVAGLRTGQIDILTGIDWKTAGTLSNSNPDLLQTQLPQAGPVVLFNMNVPPFDDIRVRKAMQMAINRPLIAQTHFGGTVSGEPAGNVNPLLTGYAYPFDEWPADLQAEYSYDPDGARALLAEAGLAQGLSTTMLCTASGDMALYEIIKAQFLDIGVDAEITTGDMATHGNSIMNGKYELAISTSECGGTGTPWQGLQTKTDFFPNPSIAAGVNDPVYKAMVQEVMDQVDMADIGPLCEEAGLYMLRQHWHVAICPIVTYTAWQPYLKGYSGENLAQDYYARWWLAQ